MNNICGRCGGYGMVYHDHESNSRETCNCCNGTGELPQKVKKLIQTERLMELVAGAMTDNQERAASENPDGEDWRFAAAENMVTLEIYRTHRFYENMATVQKELSALSPEVLYVLKGFLSPDLVKK